MTIEEAKAQLEDMKRLVDLKAEKEKSEKKLKKIMTPAEMQAQAQKADKLPITKISYKIHKVSKDATMRIERNNQPLSLTVYEKSMLKKLGFSIPPPPELTAFGLSAAEKKRKRSSEIIKEVFVKEDIVVDGMHRNLVPPPRVEGSRGLVIREPESGIFFYNGNFDLIFQREEFHLATTAQLIRTQSVIHRGTPEAEEMFKKMELTIEARNDVAEARRTASAGIEGLAECKASASNLRRIQVKDIVKEVEDYLKTYSSAEMDISWYIEGIRCGFKESQRWQYSDYLVTL
ncbi:hypothetical protein Tco_1238878 [Tanacetum coccineum]